MNIKWVPKWVPIEAINPINYQTYWLTVIPEYCNEQDPDHCVQLGHIRFGQWFSDNSDRKINGKVIAIAELEWPYPYIKSRGRSSDASVCKTE